MNGISRPSHPYVLSLLIFIVFSFSSSYQLAIAQIVTESFDAIQQHEWTVPACVSVVSMTVRGADGGNSVDEIGGEGQTILATLPVQPGDVLEIVVGCLLYTSPSPRDKRQSRMPSSA